MANITQVEEEILALKKFIKKLGARNDKGQYVVTFGILFDDDEAANTFEAIVGTLRSAKKRKIISFKGQMLLKGAHDNVPITLLKDDDDDGDEDDDNTNAKIDDNKQEYNNDTVATDDNNNNKAEINTTTIIDPNTTEDNNISNTNKAEDNNISNINKAEIIESENNNNNNGDDNKENMIEIQGRCNESGCKCDIYIENPSKWSKGKCKTCDHPPTRHKKQWVKQSDIINNDSKPSIPKSSKRKSSKPKSSLKTEIKKEIKPKKKEKKTIENEILENEWGEGFTTKLAQCINNTFQYDKESILPAKYLLHYLKKSVGFDFTGQSKHAGALKFVFVDKFGWKIVNKWGYSVRLL